MVNDKITSELSSLYYELAGMQLAMSFYILYESSTSIDDVYDGRSLFDSTASLVADLFNKRRPCGEIASDLFELRETLKSDTMTVASYADRFKLYEYYLNRKCGSDVVPAGIADDDSAARDILNAIFATDDNSLINDNIRLALAQLPLRMTKNRFFDIIDDTFKRYIGSERSSLDRLEYMILSASGALSPDKTIEYFEKEAAYFDEALNSDISAEELSAAAERLKKVVSILVRATDLYRGLAGSVNFACVCALCDGQAGAESHAVFDSMKPAIDEALKGLEKGVCGDMSETVTSCFETAAIRTDQISQRCARVEASFLDRSSDDDSEIVQELNRCHLLMSDSVFADLDADTAEMITDAAYEEAVFDRLRRKLESTFAASCRMLSRAGMAAALAELPVFFSSRTEVMNYVRDSLSSCRDRYEKMVAVRLILDSLK